MSRSVSTLRNTILALASILAAYQPLLAASGSPEPRPAEAVADKAESIDWQLWDRWSFERARAENKLIFVDVGTQWCTACKWMHEVTLSDPAGRAPPQPGLHFHQH